MKQKILLAILSICAVVVFSQDLRNPRLVSTYSGGSTSTWGNKILFSGYNNYIQESRIEVRDIEEVLRDSENTKRKIAEQERQLNEQKREIDNLKRLVSTLERELNSQKRKIDDLQRKVR
ncbi:MAG: hypothetical protein FWG79_02830 [Bacteroidales bacterium]|nr:hypothetical protein [Bacteroidales bacterium]